MSKIEDVFGQPAIYQILSKKRGRPDDEKRAMAVKIEASCRRFNNNHGSLSVDEFYNVIKLQNGVEVSKDELRRLVADLDMDKNFKISIKVTQKLRICFLKKNFWKLLQFDRALTNTYIDTYILKIQIGAKIVKPPTHP